MSRACTYFDLDAYSRDPAEWLRWDWPRKVRTALEGDLRLDDPSSTEAVAADGGEASDWDRIVAWTESRDAIPDACPHDAVEGTDRCAFHLRPDRTPATDATVSERVIEADSDAVVAANLEELDLTRCILEPERNERLDLAFCTVERLRAEKAVFRQDVSLRYATVGDLSFDRAIFEEDLDVGHSRIRGEVSGEHATFRGQVRGIGAEIGGEGPVDLGESRFEGYVCFDDATFAAPLRLWNGIFQADAEFRNAAFRGSVNARWTDFHRYPDFNGATFDSDADFGGATFHDDAGFSEVTFRGAADFQSEYNSFEEYGAVFHGVADFTDSTFRERFNLRETQFKKYASFRHADLEGELRLWNAEFDEDADFYEATFADGVDCQWVKFHGYADFNETEFRSTADFGGSTFGDDAGFSDATFRDDLVFRGEFSGFGGYKTEFDGIVDWGGSTFGGAVDIHAVFWDDVSAAGAVFEDDLEVAARFVGVADFSDVHFEGPVDFHDTEFQHRTLFRRVASAEPIDMSNIVVDSGTISQRGDGTTYYDFSRATVGEVDLEPKDDDRLFDYFRFHETTFDGFDFPDHGEALDGNWRLHAFEDGEEDASWSELISTYLKAKNGASAVGAKSAAAEFFTREMHFRRKRHWARMADGANSAADRGLAASRWLSNWFLNLSCGYGERPLRTITLSIVLIALFAPLYPLFGLEFGGSPLASLIFSAQTFVTLIFGATPEVESLAIQFVAACQAFVGAFFIALFVFALTRSVHR